MIQLSRRTVALAAVAILTAVALAAVSFVRTLSPAEAGPGFADTPPWIAAHATWLADNGIATGFPGNLFKPNDNITRGQAAFWFGNYNRRTSIVKGADLDPPSSIGFQATTACPPGRRAIGGGGQTSETDLFITDSYPSSATAWTVRWESDNDAPVDPSFLRVWALCMPLDP